MDFGDTELRLSLNGLLVIKVSRVTAPAKTKPFLHFGDNGIGNINKPNYRKHRASSNLFTILADGLKTK